LLEKLVTASSFQPKIFHFKDFESSVRGRLTLGSFGAIIGVPQAFADLLA